MRKEGIKGFPTYLGLFVSLVGFWLLAELYYAIAHAVVFGGSWSSLVYTMAQVTGFLVLLYILRLEGRDLSSIWFGERGLTELGIAMIFLLVVWVLWGLLDYLGSLLGIPEKTWWRAWSVRSPMDVIPLFIFSQAAAFFEETFYRGYAITRLYKLTDNLLLSAAISIAFFTLIHLFFGPRVMLCMLGWAIVDTALFIYRESTWASFYFHSMNNLIVYTIFPLKGLWR